MPRSARHRFVLPLLSSAALAAFWLALRTGAIGDADWALIAQLRLPRAVAAFACGGLLALAGALLQILTRNPLAEPYVLGVSGGASVGALLTMWALPVLSSAALPGAFAGLSEIGATALTTFGALCGALLSLFALGALLLQGRGMIGEAMGDASHRLILAGVMLATGYGAIVSLILALAPTARLPGMLFWLMGDLNGVGHYWPALLVWLALLALALRLASAVNLLLLGDEQAQALGLPVARMRRALLGIAASGTAVAVATAGAIGFVGLLVPHLLRLSLGHDQRLLLPACALAGGIFLLFADTLARTLIAPGELPVGVVTALIGVPTFLWLLTRRSA